MNLLADNFPCLDDRHRFDGSTVRFYKRAQILVADLWACFEGESYGYFHDIDQITMFAGMFSSPVPILGCLQRLRLPHTANATFTRLSTVQPASGISHTKT